jgi:hypothetical protein
MIPPLSVAGTAVAKYDMMTTDGSTVYVAYSRPSDTTYFDVAAYSPSSGWTAYQSTAPDDTTAQGHRPMAGVVENGHLAGYSVESDASIWREVFDLGTQAWTSSNTGSLQPQRSTIAYTNSWLVFEGAYDSPGASMCETQASTLTFPIDATSTATAPEGDDSPLGSLAEPYAVATTDHVFFFGGYNIPADSPGCNVSEPRTPLYNGAFYDPATGIWSTSVPLGPSAGSDFVDFAFAALPTGQVVVLENYTSIFGRADILAPGQTAFTAGPILPAGLWGRIDTSDDYATLAGTAAGVVVWSSGTNDGVLYDPTTNTATPICAPPGTVSNTFMASTPTGVVLLGDGQAGTSSTTSQSAYLSF